jgi:hypothetical protein
MSVTAEQLIHHLKIQDKDIEAVTRFWVSVLPTVELPSLSQIKLWLKQYDHDLETVCYGINEAGKKNQKLGDTMTLEYAAKFASKCQRSYAGRDPRRKTFRLSDSRNQKPQRNRIEEGGPTVAYVSEAFADQLGDVPVGAPLTLAQFFRCLMRIADINSGKVQRPNTEPQYPPATQEGSQDDQRATG